MEIHLSFCISTQTRKKVELHAQGRQKLELRKSIMHSMYCAEQINVPPELGTVLKQVTKAAIRDAPGVNADGTPGNPADVLKWCANYFAQLANAPIPFDSTGRLMSSEARRTASSNNGQAGGPMVTDVLAGAGGYESVPTNNMEDDSTEAIIYQLFSQYDTQGDGRIDKNELPALIADLKASLGLDVTDEQLAEFVSTLDANDDGTVDLVEFKQFFFQ